MSTGSASSRAEGATWSARCRVAGAFGAVARCFERWAPPWPFAVLLAALVVHRLPAVAPALASVALIGFGLALLWAGRAEKRAALRFVALLLAAGGWCMLRAEWALEQRLLPEQEGVDFVVQGHVTGMPQASERGERFTFHIDACVAQHALSRSATKAAEPHAPAGATPDAPPAATPPCPARREVRLTWYRFFGSQRSDAPKAAERKEESSGSTTGRQPSPQPGERWQLTVRLKRPHALLNPYAFDAELRSLQEGIAGSGTVRATRNRDLPNRRLEGRSWRPGVTLEAARTVLRDTALAALEDYRDDAAGVVVALSIGDQGAIPSRWWDSFNRTGVGHLMSIRGTKDHHASQRRSCNYHAHEYTWLVDMKRVEYPGTMKRALQGVSSL